MLVLSAGNKERGDRGDGAAGDWQTAAYGEGQTPCTAQYLSGVCLHPSPSLSTPLHPSPIPLHPSSPDVIKPLIKSPHCCPLSGRLSPHLTPPHPTPPHLTPFHPTPPLPNPPHCYWLCLT